MPYNCALLGIFFDGRGGAARESWLSPPAAMHDEFQLAGPCGAATLAL